MASVRKTKKNIRYACGDMAAETLMASHVVDGFDNSATSDIIGDIASVQVDALAKCSFSFDKSSSDFENKKEYRKAKRAYTAAAFTALEKEMTEKMQGIVAKMNAAWPKKD